MNCVQNGDLTPPTLIIMGIPDRKKRQIAEREILFLEQAWELIQRDGLLNLQMAKLAAVCEYSVGTIYQHFSSKEDLLVALASRRVGEKLELYQRAANWQGKSRDRILAVLLADILFTQKNPEYFRLAQYVSTYTVWMAASPERREIALEACKPLGNEVENIIESAVAAGEVKHLATGQHQLCFGLWAMSEGTHILANATGVLEAHALDHPYRVLLLQSHALLNGLNWQPLMDLNNIEQQQHLLTRIMQELFSDFPTSACPAMTEQRYATT